MATITVVASTGVSRIDIRCSNGYTTSIAAGGSFSWTRLAPNDSLSITNADGQSGYGGPYYANGVNIGGGEATFYISEGDQTIYVRATSKTYTITFYANGGSGRMSSLTGSSTYTMPDCEFTREGYTFSRWNTNSSGTGTSYYAGNSYTFYANTPLYAIWNINTWPITFDRNGGSGGPISGTKVYNVDYTIPSSTPTRTGYTFRHWIDNFGESAEWEPGDVYTLNSPVTFTAVWRLNTYTVSYNANGGRGAPSSQTKYYGTDLTLSSDIPTWTGHTFLGWSTSSARDATVQYHAGGKYTDNAGAVLYAVWLVSASFYSNGSLYSQSFARIGGTVTAPVIPNTATQGLLAWRLNDETSYAPGASIPISSNITLYAVWSNIYTISYDANGGSNAPASQTKWQDTDLTLSSDIPTWNGYTFFGWSTSSDRMAPKQYNAGGTYTKNEAAILYAIWRCSATFYSKGSVYTTLPARIGGEIVLPILQNTETEVFAGWLNNGELFDGGATITIATNVSFTASWVAGYTLTYNGNNADGGSTPSPALAKTYTIAKCGFYKSGYYFQYWRTASGTRYYPGDSVTPTSNMTLYAQWKARTYFYWHGSDAADNTYFAKGKRIDLAVTATAWNALCDFVNDVRTDARLSTIAFSTVSAGDEISAVKFNIVSNAIRQLVNAGYGRKVPAQVSTGQEIVTALFNGPDGLKAAINSAVDDL